MNIGLLAFVHAFFVPNGVEKSRKVSYTQQQFVQDLWVEFFFVSPRNMAKKQQRTELLLAGAYTIL